LLVVFEMNETSLLSSQIPGVQIWKIQKNMDQRGWLMEVFRQDCLMPEHQPQMSYISCTSPGVWRGPHMHEFQTDLFAFIGPAVVRLRLWDLRGNEKMPYSEFSCFHANVQPICVLVPPGVVHAYQNASEKELLYVINSPNALYKGPGKRYAVDEVRFEEMNDPRFSLETDENAVG
jgi:dTDP-4-dehydrorhamnose 3,5-epimerase